MPRSFIISENIYPKWALDEKFFINIAKKILKFYINRPEVSEKFCLNGYDYKTLSFDFLYCDSSKTHEINKEYRNKGLGTALMKEMLVKLKLKGYKQASLAVQKENYAVKMYKKVGFEIYDENDEEYIMLCKLWSII